VCLAIIAAFSPSDIARAAAIVTTSHCVFTGDGAQLSGSCGPLFDQVPKMRLFPRSSSAYGVWGADAHPTAVWSGTMTDVSYRDERPPIQLEVYAKGDGVLRTIYGWFPVTRAVTSASGLTFDLDGMHEVPPNALDRRIVQRAAVILSDANVWNRSDNRVCPANATTWSIYCAMEKATDEVSGGVDHRRPAMEVVREIIDERTAGRNYHHRLMDYNKDQTTTLTDVQSVFSEALRRMNDATWLQAHGFAIWRFNA
jgi:hypothetical protein